MEILNILIGAGLVVAGYLLCFFTVKSRSGAPMTITSTKKPRAVIKQAKFSSPIAGIDKEHLGFDEKTGVFDPIHKYPSRPKRGVQGVRSITDERL